MPHSVALKVVFREFSATSHLPVLVQEPLEHVRDDLPFPAGLPIPAGTSVRRMTGEV